jgi:hypothetical protein
LNSYEISQLGEWAEVRVKWLDAYCPSSGWHDTDSYETKDSVATTLGRVWKDCQEGYLTLVGTLFEAELPTPECVGDINHIPIAWIVSLETIQPSKEQHSVS